ncbi:unnamed protein product, partial [Caenorhabditis brenneri]
MRQLHHCPHRSTTSSSCLESSTQSDSFNGSTAGWSPTRIKFSIITPTTLANTHRLAQSRPADVHDNSPLKFKESRCGTAEAPTLQVASPPAVAAKDREAFRKT